MMSRPGTRSAVRTDGLGAAKLLIKTGVILSFLVLLTGLNYLSTGDTPILWSNGDVASISSDVAMNFYRRNLRSDEVRTFSNRPPSVTGHIIPQYRLLLENLF